MDFHYNPEDDAFRLELRTWLGVCQKVGEEMGMQVR
jgi:hypothetical protein